MNKLFTFLFVLFTGTTFGQLPWPVPHLPLPQSPPYNFNTQHMVVGTTGEFRDRSSGPGFHLGVDITNGNDYGVYAIEDGIVTEIVSGGCNRFIKITSNTGNNIKYYHTEKINGLALNQSVMHGTKIGTMIDPTGCGFGRHLHIENRNYNFLNQRLYPFSDNIAPTSFYINLRHDGCWLNNNPTPPAFIQQIINGQNTFLVYNKCDIIAKVITPRIAANGGNGNNNPNNGVAPYSISYEFLDYTGSTVQGSFVENINFESIPYNNNASTVFANGTDFSTSEYYYILTSDPHSPPQAQPNTQPVARYWNTAIRTGIGNGETWVNNSAQDARCVEEAVYPDGLFTLKVVAKDVDYDGSAGLETTDTRSVLIDNFCPYVKNVQMTSASNIYNAGWAWSAGSGQLSSTQNPYTGLASASQNLVITVTTSEPMTNVSLNISTLNFSNTNTTPVPNTNSKQWLFTIPSNTIAGAAAGSHTLSINGTDLAGNGIQSNPASIPKRNQDGTWTISPTPGNDTHHTFSTGTGIPTPPGSFRRINLSGISLNQATNDIDFTFNYFPAGPNDVPVNATNEIVKIKKLFMQALVTPQDKQRISLDINCSNNNCVGDATYSAPFQNTDLIDAFYRADVFMKFGLFPPTINGVGNNNGMSAYWTSLINQSPYNNQILASNFSDYPNFLVRACILSNNMNYSSQGNTSILINNAQMTLDRQVMSTTLDLTNSGLPNNIKTHLNGLRQNSYHTTLNSRLNTGANNYLPNINTSSAQYEEIRDIYRITAAANWYKNLSLAGKPYLATINSENFSGIGRTGNLNEPYWDGQAWQDLNSCENYTAYYGGSEQFCMWGGCDLGNITLINDGAFTLKQDSINTACFINHSYIALDSTIYGYGGSISYPSVELQGQISTIGNSLNIKEDTIEVEATVFNIGKLNANNVTVRLYEKLINGQNILISQQVIAQIDSFSAQNVNFTWIPQNTGVRKLLLAIDETDVIVEKNNLNNTALDSTMVLDNTPIVSIISPITGSSLSNESIIFEAQVIDYVDGTINPNQLVWTSDVSGVLGYGEYLDVDSLPTGLHNITFTATNSKGKTTSVYTSIYLVPQGTPLVSIVSPNNNATLSSNIPLTFTGTAVDLTDGNICQNAYWSSSLDGNLGDGCSINPILSIGNHVITFTAINSSGNNFSVTRNITVVNGIPTLQINTPATNNQHFLQNQNVSLQATANDLQDGNISANIHWSSSLQGNLGIGATLSISLPVGTHIITATIIDSHGLTASTTKTVIIDFTPPVPVITVPTANDTFMYQSIVTLTGSATDLQDGTLSGNALQWYSNVQGFLGTGNTLALSNLVYGWHIISLQATDSDGATATVSVQNVFIDAGLPTAVITSPLNNSNHFYGNSISFTGTGTDPQNGNLSGTSLVWTSSLQGNIGIGNSFTLSNLVAGTHIIRLTVTDNDSFSHYIERTITVIPPHNPQISIVTPANNTTILNGQNLNLQAIANDFEEGNLPNYRVAWASSLDGNLGTGLQKNITTLSIGTHIIGATAIDTLGATSIASINVSVLQRRPDAVIATPANNLIFAQGDTIAFSGTATDYEDGTLSGSALAWYSVQQGLLGSGNSLNISNLNTGSHEIRLIATDSNNGKDTATIFLIIQGLGNYIQTKFVTNQDSIVKNFGIGALDTTVYVGIPKTAVVSNAQVAVQGLSYYVGGALDTSFNSGSGPSGIVYTTTVQPNGKIIAGGNFTYYDGIAISRVARLNTNGSLDANFTPGNGATNAIYPYNMVYVYTTSLQLNQKIIIGGNFELYNNATARCIAGLNINGTQDLTFNVGTGIRDNNFLGNLSSTGIYAATVQNDGKIIIGGNFTKYNGTVRNCIARLDTNGTLDINFNSGSGANNHIYTILIQPDGKIIIGGNFTSYNGVNRNRIARLNTDGTLDLSFNYSSGLDNIVYTSAIQPDGKIIIGGNFTSYNGVNRNRIVRLNTDGTLDLSFNSGSGLDNIVYTTAIQSDGKIIIGGSFTSYNGVNQNRIARLNTDGTLDLSFNSGSGFDNIVYTTAIQSDGNIIIGGNFSSYNGIGRNHIARIQNSIKYPYNPYIDVSDNNTNQWSYTGQYISTQIVPNFATEINNYLTTATPLANGNVLVPIKIHADSGGIVVLKNLNIQYQYADVVAPALSASINPNPVLKNSNFTITATSSDNINVATVKALINGTLYTMTNTNGNNYSYTASLSQTGIYPIKITATDVNGLTKDTTINLSVWETGKDLVIQSMTPSNLNPYIGELISVQAGIQNLGNQNCVNTNIALKANGTTVSTQTVTVNAGSTVNLTFSWTATWGITSLQIAADPNNAIVETNELNNTATQAIQVFDLTPPTLSNFSVVPNPAFVGQTVQIQTNASDNHGIATVSATLFGQTVNMPFNAGSGKYEGIITASTAGAFTAVCTVTDTDGLSTQQTESVTVLSAGIDLTLSPLSIIATPNPANAGQSVSIAYTLQNNGNLTANNAQVSIHIDNQVYTTQTVSLAGNSNTTLSFSWNAICGNHSLSMVIDSANVIAESNEANNNATTTLQLCLAMPVVIDTVIASPQPDIQGNPILFQVGVSDALQVDSLCLEIASQNICLAWNSGTSYFEGTFTPLVSGQLSYILTLKDNNGFVYAYTDSVLVLPLAPNLAFAGVVIPTFIVQNQTFAITGTVSNIGGTNIQNAKVYFLADGNITDSTLVNVNANATASISTSYSLSYGNHTLAIQLDPQNAITESVETDNNYQSSVSVIDNQAPIFQSIQVSQPLYAGGTMSLETTIWDELPIMQANVVFNGNTYPLQIDTLTGNYTLSLNNLPQGNFTLNFSATDSSGLVGQTDYPITINNNQPDASVSAIDITYLNSLVSTTDSIQVVIHNNGGSNIASLPVRIKMDGNIIASPTVPLAMGQTDTVYTTYTNTLGTHTVSVELDPLNIIPESNETNNIASRTIYVWDDTPPTMPILSVTPNTWTTGGSFNLNWTAATDNYGIAAYEYKIENGAWQSVGLSLSTNISYTQNGVSNVYLRAKDLAGNVSENSIAQMFIDLVAPTNPLIAEWHCGDIWTTHDSPYYQWLNPGDEGSGINHYEALVDGLVINIGDSLNYHPTLLSGQHIVQIRGVDNVGNIGSWSNSDTVYIDTEIPNAPTMVSPTHPNQNQWYQNDSIALIISQLPDISGIEGFHWAITHDSIYTVAPTNYWLTSDTLIIDVLPSMDTLPTRIPDGIWYIHIAAKDGVGHLSQTFSYRVKIDKTAPETHYIVQNTTPIDTIMQCSHTFNLVVEDYPMYTTYNTFYSLTGNNFVNNASVYLPNYGLNKVYFYSVDDAGNQETLDSVLIYLAGTDTLAAPSVSCGVFDIDLLNFTATPKDAYINLQWESAKEINAAKYELERKTENYDFGFISSAIANGFASHYQYPDSNVLPNIKYYYRLKLIDNDGLYKYSKTVEAMLGDTETIVDKIYPNPTSGLLNVEMWLNENADIHFTLVNALGQVVVSRFESMQIGNNLVKLDLNGLASGVYQLQVKQDGKFIGTYSVAKE